MSRYFVHNVCVRVYAVRHSLPLIYSCLSRGKIPLSMLERTLNGRFICSYMKLKWLIINCSGCMHRYRTIPSTSFAVPLQSWSQLHMRLLWFESLRGYRRLCVVRSHTNHQFGARYAYWNYQLLWCQRWSTMFAIGLHIECVANITEDSVHISWNSSKLR